MAVGANQVDFAALDKDSAEAGEVSFPIVSSVVNKSEFKESKRIDWVIENKNLIFLKIFIALCIKLLRLCFKIISN